MRRICLYSLPLLLLAAACPTATVVVADGDTVTSEPAGIDDLTFVTADLDPGVAYHVRIFNGLCGYVDVTVNNLALVSETEAEWPADRTRTDIGVGEVVRLSLRPTLQSNVTWSCFGSLIKQEANESVVKVRATDTHGSAKVSAMIGDIRLSMQFMVFSPTGYSFAEAYTYGGANAYPGFAEVEGLIDVYLAPTNVSFANVWMEEGYAEATNVSGWFLWPGNSCNHDSEHGAFIPCEISSRNFFTDMIGSDFKPGDWIDGEMKWEIPTSWWIIPEDGASTNRHQMSRPRAQMFSIRRNGTFTITKFGTGLTRTPRGMVTEIPEKIRPIKDAPRDKPLPPPPPASFMSPLEIKPNDSPDRIKEVMGINETIASNYAARVASYQEDKVKRAFFREFDSFYNQLHVFVDYVLQ